MITHGDSDHFRLLDDLLDGVTVNTIVYGGFYKEYSPDFTKWLSSKSKDPLQSHGFGGSQHTERLL